MPLRSGAEHKVVRITKELRSMLNRAVAIGFLWNDYSFGRPKLDGGSGSLDLGKIVNKALGSTGGGYIHTRARSGCGARLAPLADGDLCTLFLLFLRQAVPT